MIRWLYVDYIISTWARWRDNAILSRVCYLLLQFIMNAASVLMNATAGAGQRREKDYTNKVEVRGKISYSQMYLIYLFSAFCIYFICRRVRYRCAFFSSFFFLFFFFIVITRSASCLPRRCVLSPWGLTTGSLFVRLGHYSGSIKIALFLFSDDVMIRN